jgi:hypothetical protein
MLGALVALRVIVTLDGGLYWLQLYSTKANPGFQRL